MRRPSYNSATIFIALRDKTAVYRSVEEVPEELRGKLEEATTRPDCATILIADQRGREEISRALRGEASPVRLRFVESVQLQLEKALPPPLKFACLRWLRWLLPVAAALICWLAFR